MTPSDVICPVCGTFDPVCYDKKYRIMATHHAERIRRAQEASATALMGRDSNHVHHIYTEHDKCQECGAEAREPCCSIDDEPIALPCDGRKLLPKKQMKGRHE